MDDETLSAAGVVRQREHGELWSIAWICAAVVCAGLLIGGLLMVVRSSGSGAAPLPPAPVVTGAPTTASTTSPSWSSWSASTTPTTAPSHPPPPPAPATTSLSAAPATTARTTTAGRTAVPAISAPAPSTAATYTAPTPTQTPAQTQAPAPAPAAAKGAANTITLPDGSTSPIEGACAVTSLALQPPDDVHRTCWWGSIPGASAGVSVITGHVNSRSQGAGFFAGLAHLTAGQTVITTATGKPRRWRITAVTAMAKAELPSTVFTDAGPTGTVLRLVTCGGELLPTGHYADNVVVMAIPA